MQQRCYSLILQMMKEVVDIDIIGSVTLQSFECINVLYLDISTVDALSSGISDRNLIVVDTSDKAFDISLRTDPA